jgi:hypothetical protein
MKTRIKPFLIRLLYIIPLLIFAYAFIEQLILVDERFRKIDYIVLTAMIIFLYQSIRNSIVGLILAMFLYIVFLFYIGKGLVWSFGQIGAKIDTKGFLIQCVFILIYLGIGLVYWKIRPKNKVI